MPCCPWQGWGVGGCCFLWPRGAPNHATRAGGITGPSLPPLPLNQVEIVEELLAYLAVADFSMREELVLKTAVLAER